MFVLLQKDANNDVMSQGSIILINLAGDQNNEHEFHHDGVTQC